MSLFDVSVLLVLLGIAVVLVGLLLRFRIGRGLLLVLLIGACILFMIEDAPLDTGGTFDLPGNPAKAGRYLLYAGGGCFSFASFLLLLHLLG